MKKILIALSISSLIFSLPISSQPLKNQEKELPQQKFTENTSNFNTQLINFVWFIASALLSGVISSSVFLYCLSRIKPKITISKEITKNCDDPIKPVYKIKVVNKTRRPIIHVSLELLLIKSSIIPNSNSAKPLKSTDLIALKKPQVRMIAKYNSSDENAEYACRFSIIDNLESKWDEWDRNGGKDNSYLEFTVFATDSLSNFSTVVKQIYHRGNIREGQFDFGDSFNII
jgi:hypothetical protein